MKMYVSDFDLEVDRDPESSYELLLARVVHP